MFIARMENREFSKEFKTTHISIFMRHELLSTTVVHRSIIPVIQTRVRVSI